MKINIDRNNIILFYGENQGAKEDEISKLLLKNNDKSLLKYNEKQILDDPAIFYNEILCTSNLLGVKGAGEAGAIGAPPAVINAICNALDIDHVDMPAKPEKLWKIISQNNKVSAAE